MQCGRWSALSSAGSQAADLWAQLTRHDCNWIAKPWGTIPTVKTRFGFATLVLSLLCQCGFGQALKPDRTISVVSIERYENAKSKGYEVEAKTSGSKPSAYYKLECGMNAADLQVGHLYKAAEAVSNQSKMLVIFDVHPDPKEIGISCGIKKESIT